VEKFFPKVPNFYPIEDGNPPFHEGNAVWQKREKLGFIEARKAEPFGPASPFGRNVPSPP